MAIASFTGLVLLGIVAAYLINRLVQSRNRDRPLPPGPKGLPVLGNVNDLPKPGMLECHHWLKHKDLYGPISSITVLGQTFVIINDAQIAVELLRDRATIHSARPHMVFASDMIGWKNTLALSGYTDTFKIHRKNIAKVAGSRAALRVFDRVQEEEAAHFLLNMLDSPENLFDHIKKEAGAVILKTTYGYTVKASGKDPLVDLAGKTMHEFADATSPGKWAVDTMPFLRYAPEWLPGTGFKRTARQMAARLSQTTEQPYQFVKQQMRENKHSTSFLSQAIENIGSDPDMMHVHKWSAASMYLGGADTTVSSLMTFFLAMTLFPEVQKKAQEELDSVIGGSRLPVTADRESLPYITAIMKETHRWHPVAPMALPHCSTKEDTINGYRIPKGALLLPNNWWFTHDPSVYPSPMTFNPDRFLDTPIHKAEPDPRNWIFGYGRRVCPGRYVADNAVFMTIAQTLAVFKVEKLVANGETVEPELKFEPGVVSHPVPYRTSVTPRSEKHAQLIRTAEHEYPWEESDAKALETVKW
ncbi:O-methylsterigmatocystin oxidoreductase [Alternaria tenuissima]|uniref:O-methylsterigmatocystin oxidoreductase n=2 Tax=Alternaria alternata complex TaxID=187734 RepID=A0A4V1WPY5_ALTAL|nr:O-methylsterigmatocystin oxidoreductase [Alternaria tenuissima]RYN64923.1 O-methylsterigmatocystin oxidoreductase [Alternaria alternata]RYN35574.1 O-methylsterigmatocystin oxidoreductase [Alternaria tenuissima]RYN89296.1 O-methylsterigmatocystin oxidoreductase [Alternaria tenuissima]RYO05934.1 O-methylsterigmatocystin oxidoreductase [Alternaria tenuissima]